jgi:hypothetical protein
MDRGANTACRPCKLPNFRQHLGPSARPCIIPTFSSQSKPDHSIKSSTKHLQASASPPTGCECPVISLFVLSSNPPALVPPKLDIPEDPLSPIHTEKKTYTLPTEEIYHRLPLLSNSPSSSLPHWPDRPRPIHRTASPRQPPLGPAWSTLSIMCNWASGRARAVHGAFP